MDHSNGITNGSHRAVSAVSVLVNNTVPLIIGGKDVVGERNFCIVNPTTGKEIWNAGGASVENAVQAVEAAEAAFAAWSKAKPSLRRDIFLRAADIFAERIKELATYLKEETGADDTFMEWILNLTVDYPKEVAGKCSLVAGGVPASSEEGRGALVLKEPYGVILGIAPW